MSGKVPHFYWELFFKPETSGSDEKKEYGAMGEGKVSYKQVGKGKTLDLKKRQKWLEKLNQIQIKKSEKHLSRWCYLLLERGIQSRFLEDGEKYSHDSSAPL